jgi:hypothetical protein
MWTCWQGIKFLCWPIIKVYRVVLKCGVGCSLRALEVGVLVGVIVAPLRGPGVVVGSVSMERWLKSELVYNRCHIH